MRVLCVIDLLGPGGAQRQFVTIAEALSRRGHSVSILTYYSDPFFMNRIEAAGIEHITMPKKGRRSLSPALMLRRILRAGGYDAVLAFQKTPSIYAELACLGLKKVRLIVSERNYSYKKTIYGAEGARMALHVCAKAVACNSHAQAAWIKSHCPWLRGRVRTIWNGVGPEWFQEAKQPERERGILRLLAVSRIGHQKNPLGLARALVLCREKQGLDVRISWVGAVNVDAAPYAADLYAFLKEHKLEEQWKFLGVREDIRALMQGHDALVLPSFYEGLPNVVCEALAVGLPVLAGDVCDHSLLVAEGERGFLFEPESPASIADAIGRFALLDADAVQRIRENEQEFARNNLSFDTCVDAYERLLLGRG